MSQPYLTRVPHPQTWCPPVPEGLNLNRIFLTLEALCGLAICLTCFNRFAVLFMLIIIALHAIAQGVAIWCTTNAPPVDPASLEIRQMERIHALACRFTFLGYHDSESELRLANALRVAGVVFYAQLVVPNRYGVGYEYLADLAYVEPELGLKIAIEVDGDFKEDDPLLQEKMLRRDDWFLRCGWHVLRFRSWDCFLRSAECAGFVNSYIAEARLEHSRYVRSFLDSQAKGNE